MHPSPHLPAGSTLPDGLLLRAARGLSELDPATLYRIGKLRQEIFVVEQNCVYLDFDGRDLDPETVQLWIETVDGEVVATVRILDEGADEHSSAYDEIRERIGTIAPGTMSIGRVATDPRWRGRGLAAILMRAAIAECGEHPVILFAQSHLTHWYGRFGFQPCGDEFLEDGIPHTPMRLATTGTDSVLPV